ncbi:hypothetical protein HELRODRAFT_101552 [Helobdella robusta]|uniref:Thioredoxin domain-containing protein n=1 Tax=Helobdella robusta TaxID=6412 RepID=T1ED54_HELRO|nr:hypothetical protein HELRODRAFT_101552 [Helobdella robusta]ESN99599.1 hypothetical protein HELRODRAFT_101552 [Helobdella robusta]
MNDGNFHKLVTDGRHFIKFFVPRCSHCKQLEPIWKNLADSLDQVERSAVTIAQVDCTESIETCRENDIKGYPTIILYDDGSRVGAYTGARDLISMKNYLSTLPFKPKNLIVELTGPDLSGYLDPRGSVIVRFYDPHCPNCKDSFSVWKDVVATVSRTESYKAETLQVNCKEHDDVCKTANVLQVPTIIFYKGTKKLDIYRGSHKSLSDLLSFIHQLHDKTIDDDDDDDDDDVGGGHGNDADDDEGGETRVGVSGNKLVRTLDMRTVDGQLATSKYVFIKFYVPWCEFCKHLSPTWMELAFRSRKVKNVVIAEVNCADQKHLCDRYDIRGYPTMLLILNGKTLDMYTGSHEVSDLHDYLVMMMKYDGSNISHYSVGEKRINVSDDDDNDDDDDGGYDNDYRYFGGSDDDDDDDGGGGYHYRDGRNEL